MHVKIMSRLCLELTFKWGHKKWKLYLTYFTFLTHFAAKHAGNPKKLPTFGFTRQSSFSKNGTPDNSDSKYCWVFNNLQWLWEDFKTIYNWVSLI